MKVIVGLGNPDGIYKKTYHNIGFMVVDRLAKKLNVNFNKTKCKAEIAKGDNFVLAKPKTYMNLSGDSVIELKKYFNVPIKDIIIVLDDIDLPKGKLRFRELGSAGTHNGLRDIVSKVGQTPRLRIGISKPDNMPLADYVLSNIDMKSLEILNPVIDEAVDMLVEILNKDED